MAIPPEFHTVTPYLLIPTNAAQAIAFYKKAFDAEQLLYLESADGRLMHGEIRIGTSPVMIGDPTVSDPHAPHPDASRPNMHLLLYVEDVDRFVERALHAGATLIAPVADNADGDRRGGIQDPFGFIWFVATQIKQATRAQMQQAFDAQRDGRA